MKFTTKLLGTACALAFGILASTAASAAVNGTISGSYANSGGSGGDLWGANGSLEGMVGDSWGLEGDANYHDVSGGGGSIWAVGGNAFWQGDSTRLNLNVTYHDLGTGFGSVNFTNYGVGGEWFAGDNVTLAVRGGGLSGSGTNGGYVGGNIAWYVMPNLNINGGVDYTDLGSGATFTSEDIGAEWLFSESTPVSLYGGYQHVEIGGGGGNGNVWFIGIKLYANAGGGGSLIERQRTGTLGYIGQSPFVLDKY